MHFEHARVATNRRNPNPLESGLPKRPARQLVPSKQSSVSDVRSLLSQLSAAQPLLCFSQLGRPLGESLANILARGDRNVVKVTGLGKGVQRHRVTRPDLLSFGAAVVVDELSHEIVSWYSRHFDRRLVPNIPTELLPSAAVRATWSIGRMLLAVHRLEATAQGGPSAGSLSQVSTALAELAARWSSHLPTESDGPSSRSEEFASRTSVSDWDQRERQRARTTGSALAADIRYEHVVEAHFRPAVTWTPVGRAVHAWEMSSDATSRVLASIVCNAGVLLADAPAVRLLALEQAHQHIWAAAAVALFPAPDTLERCLLDDGLGRTALVRRWSAAQIRASMERRDDLPDSAATTRISLTFDNETLREAQRVSAEILGAKRLRVA
jgi:hypothetical protein